MEPHTERLGGDADHRRHLRRLEAEDVDHHERFPVGHPERREGALEVNPLVCGVGSDRDLRQLGAALEKTGAHRFQEHSAGDAEEPRLDGGVPPETEGRAAGTHESLLRELLCILSVADDLKEVREHGLLMGPEDIFKLHTLDGRSR